MASVGLRSIACVCGILLLGGPLPSQGDAAEAPDGTAISNAPRYNDIQVIGTHNSYHEAPNPAILGLLASPPVQALLAGNKPPAFLPQAWEYTHPDLTTQLNSGMREIELDTYYDPQGGLFGNSAALQLAGLNSTLGDPSYQLPGSKVLHVPDVDFNTTCILFVDCLREIRAWSDANPGHFPLTVFLEVKRGGVEEELGPSAAAAIDVELQASNAPGPGKITEPLAVNETVVLSALETLEDEVLSIIPRNMTITPDDVIGDSDNLRGAVIGVNGSWPLLEDMLGKFVFVLTPESRQDYYELYPSLEGALFFTSGYPVDTLDDTSLGFLQMVDSPLDGAKGPPHDEGLMYASWPQLVDDLARGVRKYVEQGYMVKAYADVDTYEARDGFEYRRDALLANGAQFVLTDFSRKPTFFQSNYMVSSVPGGGVARCNPVFYNNASDPCLRPGGWPL